ncbi:hypothetical protein [Pollutibacter soli]|uniref:hypothetical protein n=1 Tax=Pollutibacter soli TaxID=3034157 RepID=UPI0030141A8E
MQKKLFLLILVLRLTNVYGQVPVHEEPRHHLVFQNKDIRILNVLLPPGDTSLYHIHNTLSLFIRLSDTKTGSQNKGRQASGGSSTSGTVLFENLSPPNTRTHRVWNADIDTFHVMDVELLYKDSGFIHKPLTLPDLTIEIDTPWIRAYRIQLPKGKDFKLIDNKQSFVLVSLHASFVSAKVDGKENDKKLSPGSFFVIEGRQNFSIINNSDESAAFILLELPLH